MSKVHAGPLRKIATIAFVAGLGYIASRGQDPQYSKSGPEGVGAVVDAAEPFNQLTDELEQLGIPVISRIPKDLIDPDTFIAEREAPELWLERGWVQSLEQSSTGEIIYHAKRGIGEEDNPQYVEALFDNKGNKLYQTAPGDRILGVDPTSGFVAVQLEEPSVEDGEEKYSYQIHNYLTQKVYNIAVPDGQILTNVMFDASTQSFMISIVGKDRTGNVHYGLVEEQNRMHQNLWGDLYAKSYIYDYPTGQNLVEELEGRYLHHAGKIVYFRDGVYGVEEPVITDPMSYPPALKVPLYATSEINYYAFSESAVDPFMIVDKSNDTFGPNNRVTFYPGAHVVTDNGYVLGWGEYTYSTSNSFRGLIFTKIGRDEPVYDATTMRFDVFDQDDNRVSWFGIPTMFGVDITAVDYWAVDGNNFIIISESGLTFKFNAEGILRVITGEKPEGFLIEDINRLIFKMPHPFFQDDEQVF